MGLRLYAHPFSSYCWKVLIALYEKGLPFEFMMLGPGEPDNGLVVAAGPGGKFPVLVDGEHTVFEASIIIEYLDRLAPQPRMIPDGPSSLDVRLLDRVFDNYVMAPMQAIVFDRLRPEEERNPADVRDAEARLDRAYQWIDARLAGGDPVFQGPASLVACAAAPSLFYADWVREIPGDFAALRAYRQHLLSLPSVARVIDEARPYREFFPGGAPDRD